MMVPVVFKAAESWSVTYRGVVYDDARKIDGIWYYRDPTSRAILRFLFQDGVVPLQANTVR